MRLLFLILVLLPAASAIADDSDVEMRVKPVLCITDENTPSCDMSFLVHWSSGENGYYCLFNDFGGEPLRCWSDEQTGEHEDERSVQESFSYWMSEQGGTARLATVTVEVLRMDTDDRRRRRRTRHVWDLL